MKRILLIFGILSLFSCAQNSLIDRVLNYANIPEETENLKESVEIEVEGDGEWTVSDKIPAPVGIRATKGEYSDRIEISWEPVLYGGKTTVYYVYRSEDGVNYTLITPSPLYSPMYTQYADTDGLDPQVVYYYRVRAYSEVFGLAGGLSVAASGSLVQGASYFSATLRENSDYVEVRWDAVDGALYYTLERAQVESGGDAPLSDGAYSAVGNPITESSFDEETQQFIYRDYSTSEGGDLIPQYDYFYRLYAHKDSATKSRPSYAARGALLAIGVPGQPTVLNVTKGLIQNQIRVTWSAVTSDSYLLYRITQADLDSGNTVGTEIRDIQDDLKFGENGSNTVTYYDKDPSISEGAAFWYRVAAKNSVGIGRSSKFETSAEQEASYGYGLRSFDDEEISVAVSRQGFIVGWTPVEGASSYYIFRYGPVAVPGSQQASAIGDDDWKFAYEASVSETSWLDTESGADIEQEEMFYRVVPVASFGGQKLLPNTADIFKKDEDGAEAFLTEEIKKLELWEGGITIEKLAEELTDVNANRIGWCGVSAPASDYTVPVPQILSVSATQADKNNLGNVRVTGKIDIKDEDLENLSRLNFTLKRVCYYGDETGVYPLAEPRKSIGGVSFEKKGQPHVEAVETFDLNQYFNKKTKEFTFNDPMHAFRDGQPIADSSSSDGIRRHKWDYAAWDTEAWKDIKRQKAFDMERAVKIHYTVSIERKGDPEWNPSRMEATGWPALTYLEFAHLANWLKDTAINRLSIIMIPRYAWTKTISFLMGANQKVYGENSKGKAAAWLTVVVQGFSGSGNGGIERGYSDWPGFTIQTDQNISLTAGLDSNKRQSMRFRFSFTTPLYSGSCDMQIGVRDYNYQWGLWDNNGSVAVTYTGVGSQTFKPGDLIPYYEATNQGQASLIKNGLVLGREAFDTGGEEFPFPGDTNAMTFTRINLKYRPVPVNADFAKERYPEQYYNYGK